MFFKCPECQKRSFSKKLCKKCKQSAEFQAAKEVKREEFDINLPDEFPPIEWNTRVEAPGHNTAIKHVVGFDTPDGGGCFGGGGASSSWDEPTKHESSHSSYDSGSHHSSSDYSSHSSHDSGSSYDGGSCSSFDSGGGSDGGSCGGGD